jgi:hypothetical protein
MNALKRFILWDYPRASWQYDVMVILILAFIFAIPREVFRDQPKAASVALVRGGYWIEPAQLNGVAENQMAARATALVNAKFKSHSTISLVEPIYDDAEKELKGYLAFPQEPVPAQK